MTDDFDGDGFACPPLPRRPKGKRVTIHQHSQHSVVELDGPYGPIRIESSNSVIVETVENDLRAYRFDDGFAQPSPRRLSNRKKR
jgi:hypothetical protein